MNATISKIYVFVLALLAFAMVNCSKGGGGDTSSTTCPANQLYTTGAGCLPQCGAQMVWYNNQCMSQYSLTGMGALQTCGAGSLQSQYGCLPQCGTGAVMYNGQCVPVTGTIGGVSGVPIGGNICSGTCGSGMVQTMQGCMPQGTCGACYGFANGWCYIGVNAHQYYGY